MDQFHYTASGLDYVWLTNGFTVKETAHGRGVSITDAEGLHRAIANAIVTGGRPLRGQEVRFLRSVLDLSQKSLGRVLGLDRSTVSRWEGEPNVPLPDQSERLLRMYYALHNEGDAVARELTELLQEEDEDERQLFDKAPRIQLGWDDAGGWSRAA